MEDVVVLYRPVGQAEIDLIRAASFAKFPPRLPAQPIFYPVLNEDHAIEIARDWNTKDAASGHAGFVTGSCWIPEDEQEDMHRHMVGPIEVIGEFRGQRPAGPTSG